MYRIGIDLGGTNIAAGLVNEEKRIVDSLSVKTNAPRPVAVVIEDMAELVDALIQRNELSRSEIASVGVGVPCTVNEENGHLEDANNLGWDDEPFLNLLGERLQLPVFFGNDANTAAWAEYCCGDYAEDSFLMLTIGTGIGGGIILGGKLWAGVNGAAGEFGHLSIKYDGIPCTCGRRGCFEAYGSANALIEQARGQMESHRDSVLWQLCSGDSSRLEAKTVFDGAAAGDTLSEKVLDQYTDYLAEGIASVINLFQPAYLCIGGGVSRAGDALLIPVREKVKKLRYSQSAKKNTNIILAKLNNDAGIIGAALLGC